MMNDMTLNTGVLGFGTRLTKSISDAFTGRNCLDIKEYLEENSKALHPESFKYYPLHVQDWLIGRYGGKEKVLCIDTERISQEQMSDIGSMLAGSVYNQVGMIPFLVSLERYEVEYDPRYIQLVTGAFVYTPNGNILGMRNLKHDTVEGVLTIPQGHLDARSEAFKISRLSDVARINMQRELTEEVNIIDLDGNSLHGSDLNLKLKRVTYDIELSPRHLFIIFSLNIPDTKLISGREDYNTVELYHYTENIEGDFLMEDAQNNLIQILKPSPPILHLTMADRQKWNKE